MKTFSLIVDKHVQIWRRDKIDINAETLEEAVKKALESDYIPETTEYIYETELLDDDPKFPTIEVMDEHGHLLADNYENKE